MIRFNPPIHPGEVLREEFLIPFGIKPYTLAKHLNVQRTRIERIAAEKQPITPDTALRLARFFGNSPEFWLNLQASYDIAVLSAERGDEIEAIEPLTTTA
ncbi:HigA family addiction module antidote protein [Sinorhizobium medicae]|uniref:Transcriptional regulator n=1 Tax=Sinorhizobium medicae TaxID=110321 RepID=A0ABX4TR47_9HYPH|nr:HigA family addiction module antitoxin [Sinorhizobium medicae]MDX0598873.1 HigA family addiction module antidote protein [Sinorhizobium medicae]MDX0695063.1 HigA family addiction module antidote protein [Sinorhizobium medicae]MDX0744842.1 HigA family addiction module antidote protein [Sinorhizobium medicae]MDX0801714.1 HigA family addiction module antidote protein [Sinorhizobium medicae]MDX1194617.1 HigA family addiction module antidote protein [Sinorhizobium medicae]